MQKNNESKTKLFEFLTLFTMVIGTVIGTGIYMKNNELLKQTQNPIVALVLWGVVGLVCVISMAVFVEISSSTKHIGNGTIGNWAKLFINRKVASWISMFYLLVYIPSSQAFFVGSFIMYLFDAIGMTMKPSEQLAIYLICGILILAAFTFLHVLAPKYGIALQVFGTIFKFIPLAIALIAGFVLIDRHGGMSAMFNGGYDGATWSTSTYGGTAFIGGFGAILFSFDGYIYIANAQRDATHKEVVPKALFFGMIFVAIFYVLMALSLFLGSPDGSIQKLLEKVFAGGNQTPEEAKNVAVVSRVISNVILMVISILNVNVFTYIGTVGVQSDADVGLLYAYKGKSKFTQKGAAWYQTITVGVVYVSLLLLGFFVPFGEWDGITTNMQGVSNYLPLTLMGNFVSAISATTFFLVALVVFFAIKNRKTNKVEVIKVKFFIPLAWFSAIAMTIFTACGLFMFIVPNEVLSGKLVWWNSEGMVFTAFWALSLVSVFTFYFVQEKTFIKHGIYQKVKKIEKQPNIQINKK